MSNFQLPPVYFTAKRRPCMSTVRSITLPKPARAATHSEATSRSRRLLAVAVLAFACRCSAQYHLETNYAEDNPANARLTLFGDWFGVRSKLAEKGVTFNIE